MVTIGPAEILFALLFLLLLSLIAGMFLVWGWVLQQLLSRRPILPERRMVIRRQVPWNAGTVLLVVLVCLIVGYQISRAYTLATGRMPVKQPVAPEAAAGRNRKPHEEIKNPIPAVSGEANTKTPAQDQAVDGQPRGHQAAATTPPVVKDRHPGAGTEPAPRAPADSMTEMMAVSALTDIVLLMLLPVLVRITSGARLRDFGLSFEAWWRQAGVGIVAALAAVPLVYLVQSLATQIWENNAHPVQKMLLHEFSPGVAELAILSGVIVAPMFEELLFRGILQSWLVRLFGRRVTASPPQPRETVIELAESPPVSRSWDPDFGSREADAQNGLAAQTPRAPDPARGAPSGSGRLAIVLTSLLFAAIHAPQWPAPIGLFFLALVIGTVYHRTGSLIAAIFVHATFNGLSTLAMFTALLAGQIMDANKAKVGWSEAPRDGKPSAQRARVDAPTVIKPEFGPDFSRRDEMGLLEL
jgi:membrane protease YdiL (CAAX protease family)